MIDPAHQIDATQLRIISERSDCGINHVRVCHRFIALHHDNQICLNMSDRFSHPVTRAFVGIGCHDDGSAETFRDLPYCFITGCNINGIQRFAHGDAFIDMFNHGASQYFCDGFAWETR